MTSSPNQSGGRNSALFSRELDGVVGGLTGSLIGIGIPAYEAKRYEGRIKGGGLLISVHCDDREWTRKAKSILEQTGAEDVSSMGESSADFEQHKKPRPRAHA